MSNTEQTLSIIKPDAVERNLENEIKEIFKINGFKIVKEKKTGCTVHYVNSKLDSGKIILQKKIIVRKKDTPKTLASKVLKEEHILYRKALMKLFVNP